MLKNFILTAVKRMLWLLVIIIYFGLWVEPGQDHVLSLHPGKKAKQ